MSSSASSATPDVVSAEWLAKHKNSVVILDVSYQMKPKTDPAEFKEKYYGRFEEIMAEKVELAKLRFFNASSVAAGFNFPRNCGEPASKFLQEEHKKKLR
ncbi:unnamed protein product [Heligmosomoides polygyrus]|uniref:Polysacc_synt_4 domain-containing protein n=1 Tax=Heligmosomoides polygyrus TaxID=6339 RepID=A0A183FBH4_HELPZ|nr:unnamed protein product [Heligmosomoides polygyrus]